MYNHVSKCLVEQYSDISLRQAEQASTCEQKLYEGARFTVSEQFSN